MPVELHRELLTRLGAGIAGHLKAHGSKPTITTAECFSQITPASSGHTVAFRGRRLCPAHGGLVIKPAMHGWKLTAALPADKSVG